MAGIERSAPDRHAMTPPRPDTRFRCRLSGWIGNPLVTLGLVAILSVIWLIMIAIGHRRYWALTWPGVIMVICMAQAWLDVRRGPS